MSSDSDRGQSSEPNDDLSSSENHTFHDDDEDGDDDDSSAPEMIDKDDEESVAEEKVERASDVDEANQGKMQPEERADSADLPRGHSNAEAALSSGASGEVVSPPTVKVIKVGSSSRNLVDSSESELDIERIEADGLHKPTCDSEWKREDRENVKEAVRVPEAEFIEGDDKRVAVGDDELGVDRYAGIINDDNADVDVDVDDDDDDDDVGIEFQVRTSEASGNLLESGKFSKSDSDVEMRELPKAETTDYKITKDAEAASPASTILTRPAPKDRPPQKALESFSQDLHASFDEQRFRDNVRESIEYFYSAQDLLDYGLTLSSDLRTPDKESGYFEKSESDVSRDEYDAGVSARPIRRLKPPRMATPTGLDLSVSEGLRIELNRFQSMIDSIERERFNNNNVESRQHTLDSVLSLERNYHEVMGGRRVNNNGARDREHDSATETLMGHQRGYWSTVFGQASQIESGVELTLDERFSDIQKAHRALELLEDYHSRLSEPQDRALRIAIERVIRIFKSRLFQALLARDFMKAYHSQSQCIQAVVKMLQLLKEENWCLPVMYTTCLDLRVLAQKCEMMGKASKPGEILEKAADCLMSCFRVCAADNRSADEDTKRLGMLTLVNQLFKVYFRINKLHLCKPLIRAIESSAFRNLFPLPERITYKYFVGRKAMFDSDYKGSVEDLSFAFENCPAVFARNKRLILIYLVPVKMLLGYMPKYDILERYDVLQFHELAVAFKEGNVRKFDEVIQRHEAFFIKCGIYLLVEKLKFIVYRNLFKRVYLVRKTHQLEIRDFRAALQFVGEDDISIEETHCILSNLIFEGKIKGYISLSHGKLVVSKQNPFPPLKNVS